MVLGGFAGGVVGVVRSWERRDLDRFAVKVGYMGGAAGLLLWAGERLGSSI